MTEVGEAPDADAGVPAEEERLLVRVTESLAERAGARARAEHAYDQELVSLRDEIGEARLEDVPALIAQMERLQGVSLRRAEAQGMLVDPQSPYFAHLRLRERVVDDDTGRVREGPPIERDVLIGRATFVDAARRISIVDWRHAPVSQLYYRYSEGSDYEERFGDREVEGEILARRTLTIEQGVLLRIATPAATWQRSPDSPGVATGGWHREEPEVGELAGGQGTAIRPGTVAHGVSGAELIRQTRGVLGAGARRAAAAPGSASAGDRGADRSPSVRAGDLAPARGDGHPGWGGQRQDHHRASPHGLPGLHPAETPPRQPDAGRDLRIGAGGVHLAGAAGAGRARRAGRDLPGLGRTGPAARAAQPAGAGGRRRTPGGPALQEPPGAVAGDSNAGRARFAAARARAPSSSCGPSCAPMAIG